MLTDLKIRDQLKICKLKFKFMAEIIVFFGIADSDTSSTSLVLHVLISSCEFLPAATPSPCAISHSLSHPNIV